MHGTAYTLRPARVRPADAVAAAATVAYLAALALIVVGRGPGWLLLPLVLPPLLAPLLVFRRTPLSPLQSLAVGTSVLSVVAVAIGFAAIVGGVVVLVIPIMALSTVLVVRFPAATVVTLIVFSGAFGSLQALLDVPAPKLTDPLLGGLWLGAGWFWMTNRSRYRARLWPGIAILAAYAGITAAQIPTTYDTTAGIQAFRYTSWYLGAAVLVAYAPWSERARRRMLEGAIVAATLIGAYCAYRWIVGPAAAERELAAMTANNFLDDELRPVGSFGSTKAMSAWMGAVLPFLGAIALTRRDRYRGIAVFGFGACLVALLAADVRAGVGAAATGSAVVLVLYALAQAFRGRRGLVLVLAGALGIGGAAGTFVWTLGDKQDTSARYEALLDPTSDPSYQARVFKWRSAIRDIDERPFGHGLATAGGAQQRYGRFSNIGSIDIDNSYLKVAYEQGFFIVALLAAGFLLVLGQLMLRAITVSDPARAGPAIAACGTLSALLVLFSVGEYIEGLHTVAAWIFIGLGISQFTLVRRDRAASTAPADQLAL